MADQYTLSEILFDLVLPEMWNTIYMLLIASALSLIFGLLVALLLNLTKSDGLKPNRIVFAVTELIVDLLMSIPFIVLAMAMTPLTVLIVGTSIGKEAALVPLTIVTTPVFAKFIFDGMQEVNRAFIEAAQSFGASTWQVLRLTVREAIPAIISGTTLSAVTTLSSIAMIGAVGAGGIGSVAIIYGYQRYNYTVIWMVVIILAIFTQILQMGGERMYKKWR